MSGAIEILWPKAAPGKARPRAFFNRHTGRASVYTPDQTAADEDHLMFFAREAMAGRPPIEGPVRLTLHAIYKPPKSWSGRKQRESIGTLKTSKPDLDNIEKLVKDALNGICWVDDAQVGLVEKGKWWGDRDLVRITVAPALPAETLPLLDCALSRLSPMHAAVASGALFGRR